MCIRDSVYCVNRAAESKAKALRVLTIRENRNKRYIMAAIDVIEKLQEQDPKLQIDNLGEVSFIVDYQKPGRPEMCIRDRYSPDSTRRDTFTRAPESSTGGRSARRCV